MSKYYWAFDSIKNLVHMSFKTSHDWYTGKSRDMFLDYVVPGMWQLKPHLIFVHFCFKTVKLKFILSAGNDQWAIAGSSNSTLTNLASTRNATIDKGEVVFSQGVLGMQGRGSLDLGQYKDHCIGRPYLSPCDKRGLSVSFWLNNDGMYSVTSNLKQT